jgi:hypothetical protein
VQSLIMEPAWLGYIKVPFIVSDEREIGDEINLQTVASCLPDCSLFRTSDAQGRPHHEH